MRHWAIIPKDATTYGNVLYIVLICLAFALIRVRRQYLPYLIAPTIYVASCCWEARLVVNPSITAQILIGAILIAMMAAAAAGSVGLVARGGVCDDG